MGLRSSDESGLDSPQETWARMEEVRLLRIAVRELLETLQHTVLPPRQKVWLQRFKQRPEVKRAVDKVYEGIVK